MSQISPYWTPRIKKKHLPSHILSAATFWSYPPLFMHTLDLKNVSKSCRDMAYTYRQSNWRWHERHNPTRLCWKNLRSVILLTFMAPSINPIRERNDLYMWYRIIVHSSLISTPLGTEGLHFVPVQPTHRTQVRNFNDALTVRVQKFPLLQAVLESLWNH